MNDKTTRESGLLGRLEAGIQRKVNQLNDSVNEMNRVRVKWSFILIAATMASLFAGIMIKGFFNGQISWLKPIPITPPKYIYMDTLRSEKLSPLATLRGEIEGNDEAFYLAMDEEGNLFINRNLEHSVHAFEKLHGWQQISRNQLEYYEKHMQIILPGQAGYRITSKEFNKH